MKLEVNHFAACCGQETDEIKFRARSSQELLQPIVSREDMYLENLRLDNQCV